MTGLLPLLTGSGGFRRPLINPLDRFLLERSLLQDTVAHKRVDQDWTPALDVIEQDGEFIVQAEVPGLDKKDIDITLTEGLLTIKGEKARQNAETETQTVHVSERRYGAFIKTLRLPESIDAAGVKAVVKDGVLTIALPKAAGEKPRRVAIRE